RCAVMPSAPAAMAALAACTGSGWRPPRAFRIVATWSMFTPRRRYGDIGKGCSGLDLPVHPFDLCYDRLRPQLRDDRGAMLQVPHFQVDHELGEVGRTPRHADIVDVAVVLGDHLRNLRQ